MTDSTYITDQFQFFLLFIFYFFPALVGSVVSFYTKNILDKKKSKKKLINARSVVGIILSAVAPSFIMTSADKFLRTRIDDSNMLIGLSFLMGCIGSEILNTITSFSNLFKLFSAVGNHIEELKSLTAVLKDLSTNETNDDNDKPE